MQGHSMVKIDLAKGSPTGRECVNTRITTLSSTS